MSCIVFVEFPLYLLTGMPSKSACVLAVLELSYADALSDLEILTLGTYVLKVFSMIKIEENDGFRDARVFLFNIL